MGPPRCRGGLCDVSSTAPAPAAAPSCGFLLPGAVASEGVQRRLPPPAHTGEFPMPGRLGSARGSQGHLQPPRPQPEDLPSGRAVGLSSGSCEGPMCIPAPLRAAGCSCLRGRLRSPGSAWLVGVRWCRRPPCLPFPLAWLQQRVPRGRAGWELVARRSPPWQPALGTASCPAVGSPGSSSVYLHVGVIPSRAPRSQPCQSSRCGPWSLPGQLCPRSWGAEGVLVPAHAPGAAAGPGQSFPGDGGGCSGISGVCRGKS